MEAHDHLKTVIVYLQAKQIYSELKNESDSYNTHILVSTLV